MAHWMFSCRDVTQRVSESLDRSLPLHHRMMIRFHLMMCKYCTRFKKHLLIIREAIRTQDLHDSDKKPSLMLSPQARERLKRTVQKHITEYR